MSNQRTFSVNGAADILERDRRTIRRALKIVPPDAMESGHPRWRLRTVIDALDAHGRHTGHDRSSPLNDDQAAIHAYLMEITSELQSGFERLRAEPDIERRREMALEVGPGVGRLIDLFERDLENISADSRPFTKIGTDAICGQAIAELLYLCQWELKD